MTEPYYTFLNAQMEVDVASILGGEIPFQTKFIRDQPAEIREHPMGPQNE